MCFPYHFQQQPADSFHFLPHLVFHFSLVDSRQRGLVVGHDKHPIGVGQHSLRQVRSVPPGFIAQIVGIGDLLGSQSGLRIRLIQQCFQRTMRVFNLRFASHVKPVFRPPSCRVSLVDFALNPVVSPLVSRRGCPLGRVARFDGQQCGFLRVVAKFCLRALLILHPFDMLGQHLEELDFNEMGTLPCGRSSHVRRQFPDPLRLLRRLPTPPGFGHVTLRIVVGERPALFGQWNAKHGPVVEGHAQLHLIEQALGIFFGMDELLPIGVAGEAQPLQPQQHVL